MLTKKRAVLVLIAVSGLAAALITKLTTGAFRLDAKAYLGGVTQDYGALKALTKTFVLPDPVLTPREEELALFGRKLFFDKGLSRDGTVACANCHQPERSFTDGLPLAKGLALTARNAPTLVNVFAQFWFFWDGRADSLAAQAVKPIEDDKEHGITRAHVAHHVFRYYREEYEALFGPLSPEWMAKLPPAARAPQPVLAVSDKVVRGAMASLGSAATIRRLAASAATRGVPAQDAFFREVVGETPVPGPAEKAYAALDATSRKALNELMGNVGLALEAFEKGIVANQSPFDAFVERWLASNEEDPKPFLDDSFGARELLGLSLFVGKGACQTCHNGGAFSDSQFHNIGLPEEGEILSLGRSIGILKTLRDEFNCHGAFAKLTERQQSQSCLDLAFLDAETPEAVGSFKTPTLRNLTDTAPYMRDGRFATLREVIDHYDRMDTLPAMGFREETLKPLKLNEMEKQALEAFLESLTSPVRF